VLLIVGGLNLYTFDVDEPPAITLSLFAASVHFVPVGWHPTTKVIKLEYRVLPPV
jgi:hypothetical protein